VTIYRLISEKTIEENILKKAMQKRRLGEMAIDEAEFTPEFFSNTDNIRDLFNNEEGLADIVTPIVLPSNPNEIESAMATVEDRQDVVDAQKAQAEANVDIAEFDEGNLPSVRQSASRDVESPDLYTELINNMKPIERHAIKILENICRPELEDECKVTEEINELGDFYPTNKENSLLLTTDTNSETEDGLDTSYEPGAPVEEVSSLKTLFRKSNIQSGRKSKDLENQISPQSSRSSARIHSRLKQAAFARKKGKRSLPA